MRYLALPLFYWHSVFFLSFFFSFLAQITQAYHCTLHLTAYLPARLSIFCRLPACQSINVSFLSDCLGVFFLTACPSPCLSVFCLPVSMSACMSARMCLFVYVRECMRACLACLFLFFCLPFCQSACLSGRLPDWLADWQTNRHHEFITDRLSQVYLKNVHAYTSDSTLFPRYSNWLTLRSIP